MHPADACGGRTAVTFTPEQLNRLFYLFGGVRDGTISRQEFKELDALLAENQQVLDLYWDYVSLCTDLCNLQAATQYNKGISVSLESRLEEPECLQAASEAVSLEMLQLWGEYEKQARAIHLPQEDESEIPVSKIPVEKPIRRVSRSSLLTIAVSLAAILVLLVYIYLHPYPSYEVATVLDAIDAQSASGAAFREGQRISAMSDWIQLDKGVVKIETDRGVQIILEAPAAFQFTSGSEIVLDQGRLLTLITSEMGNGFSVQTTDSKIIDMGTLFGVQADPHRGTELHVFKGKTVLIPSTKSKTKNAVDVSAGQAFSIDRQTSEVKPIALNQEAFVQAIDSKSRFLWRGRHRIDLSDVVGGGSGFGTGRFGMGLNPKNGQFGTVENLIRKSPNTYILIPSSVFIDGVFVPNGQTEQVVSSRGHCFEDCPATSGVYYADISNCPEFIRTEKDGRRYPLVLDGINYSQPGKACIFLHANLGITFDLDAFRSRLPDVRIVCFQADIGVSESVPGSFSADFWVLVDGRVRYKQTDVQTKGRIDTVAIELNENDRFLTLAATEGQIEEENRPSRIGYDWCLFANPILILE